MILEKYTIELDSNAILDLNIINDWLESVLKIDSTTTHSSNEVLKDSELKIYHFASKVLLLAKVLFQAIRVPIFNEGSVFKIDNKNPQKCSIIITIEVIEHIQKNIYFSVINTVLDILLNFMNKPKTDENIQTLFNLIDNNLIKPLSSAAGSGKSTIPILESAHKKKIPFRHLSHGIYQLGWGSKAKRFNRSIIDSDSAIGSQIAQNKMVTSMLIRNAGLPSPEHALVSSKEEALAVSKKFNSTLVIKPADQERGEGVSIDVSNDELLIEAFKIAQDSSKSKQVIVEKQVDGVCCRIFIAKSKVLYGVKRLPKSVKGDGKSTIQELIDKANAVENSLPPWRRSEPYPMDDLAIESIKASGFMLNSVVKKDIYIPLRKIESTKWGGLDEDITHVIHPHNIDIALRAAKLFNLDVAGIDIITSDISIPWHKNGAIINEVNFSPLLGGGEISKSKIATYLSEFIDGDGRIPITVIVGDTTTLKLAKKIQKEQLDSKLKSFITTHDKSFSHSHEEIYFTHNELFKRSKSLLFDIKVDSLILVIQTDELLNAGLPIDKIDKIIIASQEIYSSKNPNEKISPKRYDELIKLLESVTSSSS